MSAEDSWKDRMVEMWRVLISKAQAAATSEDVFDHRTSLATGWREAARSRARFRRKARANRAVSQIIQDARHEAAHAVVSVRLNLPLASTDIIRQAVPQGHDQERAMISLAPGQVGVSSGFTTLVEGSAEVWQRSLPDPDARASLESLAQQVMAGPVADAYADLPLGHFGHRDDLQQVVQLAGILGIGTSNEDPAVKDFMSSSFERADEVLMEDDGAGWDRVAQALLGGRALTGAYVRALLREEAGE